MRALSRRFPDKPEEELRRAAAVFGGLVGQAIEGLEDGTFRKVLELAPAVAAAVAAPDELELMRLTGQAGKGQGGWRDGVLAAAALIFRDARFAAAAAGPGFPPAQKPPSGWPRPLSRAQLMRLAAVVEELQQARLRNVNYTLFLTLFCARLRAAAGK